MNVRPAAVWFSSLFLIAWGGFPGGRAAAATTTTGGTPSIEFERPVLDFGETFGTPSGLGGVFVFRNRGEGLLRLEQPMPDCGCTVAALSATTLLPGEKAELSFTLQAGSSRETLEKHIIVPSNDPQQPEVTLVIRADYTPLFELPPEPLLALLPLGCTATNLGTTLQRNDGKPLGPLRLVGSQPWLGARLEDSAQTNARQARLQVQIQRQGAPRRFNETIRIYAMEDTNHVVATLFVSGQFQGELVTSPETVYFGLPHPAMSKDPGAWPEAMVTRTVTVVSATGKPFFLKNLQSTLTNLVLAVQGGGGGRSYEITVRLPFPPARDTLGTISFESDLATQPRTDLPVVITISQ